MGMTMTQKIFANHCGANKVSAGELIRAKLDLVMGSDVTTPIAIQEMERYGLNEVFDPTRIVLVMDHFAPNKDIQAARNCALTFMKADAWELSMRCCQSRDLLLRES